MTLKTAFYREKKSSRIKSNTASSSARTATEVLFPENFVTLHAFKFLELSLETDVLVNR
jgi:hypothetical protein